MNSRTKRKIITRRLTPPKEAKNGPHIYFFDDNRINTGIFEKQLKQIKFTQAGDYVPAKVKTHNRTSIALQDPSLIAPGGINPPYDIIFMDRQHGGSINMLDQSYITTPSLASLLPTAPIESCGEELTRFLRKIPGNQNLIVELFSADSEFKNPKDIPGKLLELNHPDHLFEGISYKSTNFSAATIAEIFNKYKPNGWTAVLAKDLEKKASVTRDFLSPSSAPDLSPSLEMIKENSMSTLFSPPSSCSDSSSTTLTPWMEKSFPSLSLLSPTLEEGSTLLETKQNEQSLEEHFPKAKKLLRNFDSPTSSASLFDTASISPVSPKSGIKNEPGESPLPHSFASFSMTTFGSSKPVTMDLAVEQGKESSKERSITLYKYE